MEPVQKLISIVHWKGSEVLAFCGTLESVSNSRDLPFAEHSKGWMAKTFLNFNGNTCHCQANQYLWSQLKVAVASSLNLCCVQQFVLVWRVIKGWPTWSDGIYMRACAIKLNDGTQTHYLIKWVENFTVNRISTLQTLLAIQQITKLCPISFRTTSRTQSSPQLSINCYFSGIYAKLEFFC